MEGEDLVSSRTLSERDLPAVWDALVFAAEKHRGQRRRGYSSLPYVNHLIKVVETLIRIGGETDTEILQAAVLHDIVEDTDATTDMLAARFGDRVAGLVSQLTDDMDLPEKERQRRQRASAGQLAPGARKIRLADKACNMLDLVTYPVRWSNARMVRYVDSSEQIVRQLGPVDPRLESWFWEVADHVRSELGRPRSESLE